MYICAYNHILGFYWVDPNGGCVKDAVEVFCNFSADHIKTCVHPIHKQANVQSWSSPSVWFSRFNGGFQVGLKL